MKGQAAARRLLEFQTPYGTVGENAAYLAELYGVLRLLFHMAGRDAGLLVASVTLGLLKIPLALQLGQMWPWMAYVMDQGLDFGGTLITMMCASNLLALVGFVQNRLKDSFEPRFLERVQIAGVKACLSKDTAYWDSGDPAQSVTWLFQQAERVKGLMGHVETILTCAFTLGGAIIHLYTTSAKFTAVALAAALAIGAYMMWLNRLLAAVTGAMDHTLSELKGGCIESLTNIRTVQSFACELLEVSRFSGWKLAWWATKLQFRVTEALRRGSELSIDYARVLCINYGGFMLVSSGSMQVGDVILIQALLAEMLNSTFNSLVMTLRVVSIDLMFTKLYLDVLQAPVLIPQDAGVVPRAAARGGLSLQEVSFSYPARPDEPVLRGISIEVAPGSFTALVGASGSGKTTVGRLLERFYDVSGGCIFLDGIDLRDLQPRWLRRQIGYVEQEPRLYRGTIRENILYGNPNASEAQTEAAAEAARVLAFARDFPQGLDTDVASGGQSLSGGQKQRLAIARAMIRDPAVILLDEATSALDTETERAVQEALERLLSGRTTLVVAHRLSTVVRADQIVVMGGGRVLESGRHSELCQRPGGAYAALVRHQQLEPSKASQDAAGVLGDPTAEVAAGGSCESATARDVAPALDGGGAPDATAASTGDMGGLEASASSAVGVPATPGPPELVGATEPESVDGAEGAEAGIQARPRGRLPTEQQPSPVAERVEGTGGAGATAVEEPKQAADAGAEAQEALRRYMQTAAEAKRSQDNELFRTPDSDGFFRQLLWMYQLMGRRKWILFACLAVSVLEARAATRVGPAFSAASSFLDKPAEYVPAFQEYALVCVVTGVLTFVKERLKDYFEPHLAETLQWKCYYKMLHMDVDYFERTDPASIVPRVFDQADFSAMSTSLATEGIVHGAAGIIFSACEMYAMSPSTVKSTVAMAAPMGLILWFLFMGQVPHTVKIDKANAELTAIAVESLTNVRTTHAFGGDIVELAKFRRQKQAWWQAEMRRRPWHVGTDAFMTFCMTNMTFVVMVVIMRSGSGRFSSTMAGLLYMVKVFWDKALSFGFTVGALGNAKASFNALAEVLRERPLIEADVGDVPAPRAAGALEFRDVRFGYASRPGEEALRGISFSIPRGSCTAVVGHSGSGKTTLGRLLMRFHDPGAGQVLLDGRPFPSLQPQWLRRQIGYVEQEPRLFNETLWNNIRYGRLDAPSEEIFGAAMAANILQFMQSLPQGLETNVGRFGQNLSGGQKQRVAIARALLVNPAILLLDEATSALDSETEHAVHEALERLMAGRTSVVIAHRLSTVARADQVVVVDAGRVVQLGTHQELSRSGGHYTRLLTALASADSPANEGADDSPGDAGLRRRR